jgi:sensor histidine kinase regulating citrate/malate metabolism
MSIQEQQELKEKSYVEAMRYMDNAKETLKKARKEDYFYNDRKYVSSACGIAYRGVLVALDAYFKMKGIEEPKKKRKSIEYYESNMSKLNKKMLNYLDTVYGVLHIEGYYECILDSRVIAAGFDNAYRIIDQIKPDNLADF